MSNRLETRSSQQEKLSQSGQKKQRHLEDFETAEWNYILRQDPGMLKKEYPRNYSEITHHRTTTTTATTNILGTSCQVCLSGKPSKKILVWERYFSRKGPDKRKLAAVVKECDVVQEWRFPVVF